MKIINPEHLENIKLRIDIENYYEKLNWLISKYFSYYIHKNSTILLKKWLNKFLKKSLKLMLSLESLIAKIEEKKCFSSNANSIIDEIYEFSINDQINDQNLVLLLIKYWVLLPYLYCDLATQDVINNSKKNDVNAQYVRENVLKKHLRKLLINPPYLYQIWNDIKNTKPNYNSDFETKLSNTFDLYIINFLDNDDKKLI